ncbi:hypothetical protein Rsub_07208 [Raphidocelis subcapitata]|uniref:Uncharacterized protein n=1 Tax=Raphidocelis subcapitata TaxID=307507 RepID=A0A2V0P3F0_9CHLO|nr:hypothetical protein Rsub_07208 [Raphidocelis subcapitata]|eukprot:GBF94394.1 hypothetical protein Rsub_07208 [Raphidocelis subcapitata]
MRASAVLICALLALCAGAASARQLQQTKIAKLDLPPIADFLPSPDLAMMPMSDFLKKAGLPQWEELGLPPLSELMRPVGQPKSIMGKLPSRADVAKMANDTLVQVVNEMLPPELKALASVQLPRLKMQQVLPTFKLPALPKDLPPLQDLLKALPPIDPKAQIQIPGLPVKLPPAGDLVKMLEQAGQVLNSVPLPSNIPSLQEMLAVVNSVSNTVNGVIAAPKTAG